MIITDQVRSINGIMLKGMLLISPTHQGMTRGGATLNQILLNVIEIGSMNLHILYLSRQRAHLHIHPQARQHVRQQPCLLVALLAMSTFLLILW